MSKNIYFILTFLGFLWGIFGGYIIADISSFNNFNWSLCIYYKLFLF